MVSIIIVSYKRLNPLVETIKRLRAVTPQDYELIIVDNGSDEETRNWIFGQKDAIKIFNPVNLGVSVALNQGLSVARGDPIATLGPDILYPEGWLKKCLEILTIPQVGAVGIRPRGLPEPPVSVINGIRVCIVKGNLGAMVIPRRTIEKIGYFNEDYKFYAHEDADYGLRIELSGLLNVYVPELTCEHFHDADVDLSASESELTAYARLKKEWYYKNAEKLQENLKKYISGERSIYIDRLQRST